MVPGEDDGAVFRDVVDTHNVDLTEEDGEDGAEEDSDAVVEEFSGVGEEKVAEHDQAGVGEPSGGDAERGGDDFDGAVTIGLSVFVYICVKDMRGRIQQKQEDSLLGIMCRRGLEEVS